MRNEEKPLKLLQHEAKVATLASHIGEHDIMEAQTQIANEPVSEPVEVSRQVRRAEERREKKRLRQYMNEKVNRKNAKR